MKKKTVVIHMVAMLLYVVENVKAGSERPKGSQRSLSPPSGPNRGPTPSGDYSPIRPVSDWMQFRNHILQPSGK